jgi:hypothetical protein
MVGSSIREYQAELFKKRKLSLDTVTQTTGSSVILLHQDSQGKKSVDSIDAARDSLLSHPVDDALRRMVIHV